MPDHMIYSDNRAATFTKEHHVAGEQYTWADIIDFPTDYLVDAGFEFAPSSSQRNRLKCAYCNQSAVFHDTGDLVGITSLHLKYSPKCAKSLVDEAYLSCQGEVQDGDGDGGDNRNRTESEVKYAWSRHPRFRDPLDASSVEFRKSFFKDAYPLDKGDYRPNSSSLAEAGFIYLPRDEIDDRAVCMFCHCSLDSWEPNDDPMEEHIANAPRYCYFLDMFEENQRRKHLRGDAGEANAVKGNAGGKEATEGGGGGKSGSPSLFIGSESDSDLTVANTGAIKSKSSLELSTDPHKIDKHVDPSSFSTRNLRSAMEKDSISACATDSGSDSDFSQELFKSRMATRDRKVQDDQQQQSASKTATTDEHHETKSSNLTSPRTGENESNAKNGSALPPNIISNPQSVDTRAQKRKKVAPKQITSQPASATASNINARKTTSRAKRIYQSDDKNLEYWNKVPDDDLLQEFIQSSKKTAVDDRRTNIVTSMEEIAEGIDVDDEEIPADVVVATTTSPEVDAVVVVDEGDGDVSSPVDDAPGKRDNSTFINENHNETTDSIDMEPSDTTTRVSLSESYEPSNLSEDSFVPIKPQRVTGKVSQSLLERKKEQKKKKKEEGVLSDVPSPPNKDSIMIRRASKPPAFEDVSDETSREGEIYTPGAAAGTKIANISQVQLDKAQFEDPPPPKSPHKYVHSKAAARMSPRKKRKKEAMAIPSIFDMTIESLDEYAAAEAAEAAEAAAAAALSAKELWEKEEEKEENLHFLDPKDKSAGRSTDDNKAAGDACVAQNTGNAKEAFEGKTPLKESPHGPQRFEAWSTPINSFVILNGDDESIVEVQGRRESTSRYPKKRDTSATSDKRESISLTGDLDTHQSLAEDSVNLRVAKKPLVLDETAKKIGVKKVDLGEKRDDSLVNEEEEEDVAGVALAESTSALDGSKVSLLPAEVTQSLDPSSRERSVQDSNEASPPVVKEKRSASDPSAFDKVCESKERVVEETSSNSSNAQEESNLGSEEYRLDLTDSPKRQYEEYLRAMKKLEAVVDDTETSEVMQDADSEAARQAVFPEKEEEVEGTNEDDPGHTEDIDAVGDEKTGQALDKDKTVLSQDREEKVKPHSLKDDGSEKSLKISEESDVIDKSSVIDEHLSEAVNIEVVPLEIEENPKSFNKDAPSDEKDTGLELVQEKTQEVEPNQKADVYQANSAELEAANGSEPIENSETAPATNLSEQNHNPNHNLSSSGKEHVNEELLVESTSKKHTEDQKNGLQEVQGVNVLSVELSPAGDDGADKSAVKEELDNDDNKYKPMMGNEAESKDVSTENAQYASPDSKPEALTDDAEDQIRLLAQEHFQKLRSPSNHRKRAAPKLQEPSRKSRVRKLVMGDTNSAEETTGQESEIPEQSQTSNTQNGVRNIDTSLEAIATANRTFSSEKLERFAAVGYNFPEGSKAVSNSTSAADGSTTSEETEEKEENMDDEVELESREPADGTTSSLNSIEEQTEKVKLSSSGDEIDAERDFTGPLAMNSTLTNGELLITDATPRNHINWTARGMDQFWEQKETILHSSKELFELAARNSEVELSSDIDGDLTRFIAEMPEEEEQMTIRDWVEHCANNCRDIVYRSCSEMNQFIVDEYDRAIKLVESIPTDDEAETPAALENAGIGI